MFATMRSKSETVPPRLSGTGTNALPIAAYAGSRLESPPEWQTSTRLPRRPPIFLSTSTVLPSEPTRLPPGSGTTMMSFASRPRSGATIARYPFACAAFAAVTTMRSNFICRRRRQVPRRKVSESGL